MAIYLGKMVIHDYQLSGNIPSLIAIGCLYVSLKICEHLRKLPLISVEIV